MGILRFTNRNAVEGFYPENEAMPQESNAKRLLKKQIKEFYSRVIDVLHLVFFYFVPF